MATSPVAQPYARALLEIATSTGAVESMRTQLRAVAKAVNECADLSRAFDVPTVTEAERKAIVRALAEQLGLSETVRNALLLLAEKRRLRVLRDIVTVFEELADEATGLLRARVRSAAALTVTQRSALRTALETQFKRQVVVEATTDPKLLGGMQVEVAGRVYDASLQTRLDHLRAEILGEA
jgi:F-type H+-transporting ATPase subunit delta